MPIEGQRAGAFIVNVERNDQLPAERTVLKRQQIRDCNTIVKPTIPYDFLKHMLPQPELFELNQVLAIPKEDIEARHEYMLSVIKDRVAMLTSTSENTFQNIPIIDIVAER